MPSGLSFQDYIWNSFTCFGKGKRRHFKGTDYYLHWLWILSPSGNRISSMDHPQLAKHVQKQFLKIFKTKLCGLRDSCLSLFPFFQSHPNRLCPGEFSSARLFEFIAPCAEIRLENLTILLSSFQVKELSQENKVQLAIRSFWHSFNIAQK